MPLVVLAPFNASESPSSRSSPILRSKGRLFLPLLVAEAKFGCFSFVTEALAGDLSILIRGLSIEKSSCLLTLFGGGCEVALEGVPLLRFREGEDIGPTDRGMDLLGDELRCVLMGEVARGGRLILPFRVLLTSSDGSGIVPVPVGY